MCILLNIIYYIYIREKILREKGNEAESKLDHTMLHSYPLKPYEE